MTAMRMARMVAGLAIVTSVGAGFGISSAWSAPVGPKGAAAPVSTTWLSEPDDVRTESIQLDTAALLAQMVSLPDPFPADAAPGTCLDVTAGSATFPLFDGGSVTIVGTAATVCRESSWWTVSWRGQNERAGGGLDSSGSAVILLHPDGSLRTGALMNLEVGLTSYRYTPYDGPTLDDYKLTGYNFPPPLEAEPGPASTTTAAPATGADAAPAVAVAGTSDYTG